MVKRLLALLLCFAPLSAFCAVKLEASRRVLALGEPVKLFVTGLPGTLDAIDTRPLLQDFAIRGKDLSLGKHDSMLTLTLYPLHTGRIRASFAIGHPPLTRSVELKVLDGSTEIPKVRIRTDLEPRNPLVRQIARFTVEACDDGGLRWKRPLLPTMEGAQLRPLGESQVQAESGGISCTAHRWYWALTPTTSGRIEVPLPMLEAELLGQQLRFPAPQMLFDVSAIPTWLSNETAIGEPSIRDEPLPSTWPLQRPLAITMEIEGGYSPEGLRHLLALQLGRDSAWSIYPPLIEALKPKDRNTPTPRYALTLYALPATTGELAFPNLVFPYLDPATGDMESIQLAGSKVDIFNPMHKTVWKVLEGLVGAILLAAAGRRLKWSIDWRRARRRGVARVAKASNLKTLAEAVRSFSLCLNSIPATTLGQWRERMAEDATGTGLDQLVSHIEQACYGKERGSLASLKQEAMRVLQRVKLCRPRR
jgi:hypothetical protein